MLIRLYILLCFLIVCRSAEAIELVRVQKIEGEIDLGLVGPIFEQKGTERTIGLDLGLEMRYNLENVPVAVGIMAAYYNPNRAHRNRDDVEGSDWGNCQGVLYGVTGEYNFRRGKAFNPYVAAALGLGWMHGIDEDSRLLPFGRIKAGMEFIHDIRLSAILTFSRSDLCGFGVSIGFVIGGQPKRQPVQ